MSDIEPNSDREEDGLVDTFLRRVRDEAFTQIDAATVPIYGFQDNQVKQDRTGVLFQIADRHFILTASHNLKEIVKAEIFLLADFSMKHQIPIPLVEAQFHMTEVCDRDVAAIAIPPSVVADLPAHRRFLTIADIDSAPQPTRGFYAIFGFPTEWYRKVGDEQRTDSLAFIGTLYEGELNPDAFFDPNVHIALTFEENAINALTKQQRQLPRVKGMSGCGLWRLANYSKADIIDWKVDKIRLVGIQHRWFDHRQYIQGTRITYALGLIWDSYPSLHDAMKLSYPRGY